MFGQKDSEDVHITHASSEKDHDKLYVEDFNGANDRNVEDNFLMDHNSNFRNDLLTNCKTISINSFDMEEDLTRRSSESSVLDSLYNSNTSESNSLTFYSGILHEVFVSVFEEIKVPHLGRTRVTVDLGSDSEEQTEKSKTQESTCDLDNILQSSKVWYMYI